MDFARQLISWYLKNKRDFPWRYTNDPYKIWISEIILQQTRTGQGHDYYLKFIRLFPDLHSLSKATEEQVLKLWQGLGYYSRARNLLAASKEIVSKHNGSFPSTYHELLQLKGIGPYTAAAVASIAFGEPVPVIDGNVMRVISRWFAISEPVDKTEGKKMIKQSLEDIFDKNNPAVFNQAIMDFGAIVCKPKNPACFSCVFNQNCQSLNLKIVNQVPVKSKISNQRKRYFNYLVILFEKNQRKMILLQKRKPGDIWSGLYDFPLIESFGELNAEQLTSTTQWKNYFDGLDPVIAETSPIYNHQLTHQLLLVRFYLIKLNQAFSTSFSFQEITLPDITKYPVPGLIEKYLKEHNYLEHFS